MAEQSLPALSAQPRSEKLPGGEVKFWPLTISDIGEWEVWARQEFLRTALPICDSSPRWDMRVEQRTAALEEARRISLGSPKAYGPMTSLPGMLQLCWLSMRHGEKDLTVEGAWAKMCGPQVGTAACQTLAKAHRAVMVVSGFAVEADPADPSLLATRLIKTMLGE